MNTPKPPAIKACSDVLTFGKYKGKSVEIVMGIAPGYIVWLVDENICEVEDEIYQEAQMLDYVDHEFANNVMPRTYGDLD